MACLGLEPQDGSHIRIHLAMAAPGHEYPQLMYRYVGNLVHAWREPWSSGYVRRLMFQRS